MHVKRYKCNIESITLLIQMPVYRKEYLLRQLGVQQRLEELLELKLDKERVLDMRKLRTVKQIAKHIL